MNETAFSVNCRFWICSENTPFAGKGKIELLEKIVECGTLTKAASEMKMPYRQAWMKVHNMNNAYATPVVRFNHGGKQHGKTEITDFGEKVISIFKKLESELERVIAEQSEWVNLEITREVPEKESV